MDRAWPGSPVWGGKSSLLVEGPGCLPCCAWPTGTTPRGPLAGVTQRGGSSPEPLSELKPAGLSVDSERLAFGYSVWRNHGGRRPAPPGLLPSS